MNFTNDELHKLKQILNLFKKTNALDTLIQGSNITLSRNKCGQTVISSSGGGSNLPIEVVRAIVKIARCENNAVEEAPSLKR